jgi:hypothetical protein
MAACPMACAKWLLPVPSGPRNKIRLDDRDYMVEEVLDQWYGPEQLFKIRADDGNLYILRHDGEWNLVSFREPPSGLPGEVE